VSKKRKPLATAASPWRGPWLIHFFRRDRRDDSNQAVPGRAFLAACPEAVQAKMIAVLKAVAAAPPPAFSGGGYWEAMHDDMKGWFEVRVDGPNRRHYRLFCLLERDGQVLGLGGPSVVIVTGKDKAFRTVLSAADYAEVRALGDEYRSRTPRSVEP
jgi:hypothetical protein